MPDEAGAARSRRSKPASTPAARESQIASLAYDLAEKRIRAGTATAQEVVYFLKAGSPREELEQQRIQHENELLKVKRAAIESAETSEDLYRQAIDAMTTYMPTNSGEYED